MNDASTIAGRIATIRSRIDPVRTTLIAVSKKQSADRIDAALAAGQRVFGENRVQEAQERWMPRRAAYPDLRLHLIGPLQTNKARDAVALFDVIHTLDRVRLADVLRDEMQRQNRHLPCLIQVNSGNEQQKSGVTAASLPSLLAHCGDIGITVTGLMCIPPVDEPPAKHFMLLKDLAAQSHLHDLSMGMSNDYAEAAALGATYIRVGSAVFGSRS